jgi:alpha-N-arabinofuranosidase
MKTNLFKIVFMIKLFLCALILTSVTSFSVVAQMTETTKTIAPGKDTVKLTLELGKPGLAVSSQLYGLMTEEINHSYDGGLYAELIQNRIFKDNATDPAHWSLVKEGGEGSIALDKTQPVNEALTECLRLDATQAGKRIGITNDGYWGIPVKPQTTYHASFYAKAGKGFTGPLTVSIETNDGSTVFAQARVSKISDQWKQYSVTLTTSREVKPSTTNRFVISTTGTGTVWFNLVSLFPPTWQNRPNGNRIDIMQLMADMKPSFLRLPGGNFLEGDSISQRFPWKTTLGGLDKRPGHPGCWKYRASDGMGLLEFLEWCEDLKMEPVLAVFAGYALKKQYIEPGAALNPFVDEALEEIEYVTGGPDTKWGAERIKNGHPKPFPLTYVEIGNEDFFDKSGSYEGRYAQFHDAIRKKYPQLKLIATTKVKSRQPDLIDEHYYRNAMQMQDDANRYDSYDRSGSQIFVGEWATREGDPTTNLNAALGDAAWMTGMERNSDVVKMQCYAPLFVNVNPNGMQWKSDLIGYDAISSYGAPSYYAQKMFSNYLGNTLIPASAKNIPSITWQQPKKRTGEVPPAKQVATLFYSATRNSEIGSIYLKIVNTADVAQIVHIDLDGVKSVKPQGVSVVLTSGDAKDTNSITEPTKIVPVTTKINGLGLNFTQTIAPLSVNVLQIETK